MVAKKNKKIGLVTIIAITLALLFSMGAYAASTVAHIYPGKSSDTSTSIKANKSTGRLTVECGGPNYYVQGYAKRKIRLWPDSTAASLIVYPYQNRSTSFSAKKDSYYYAEIYAQPGSSGVYGEAIVSF